MQETYIENIKKLFLYYKTIGEKAIEQVEEKDLFFQPNPESNSIAIIITHLAGNMISRFTDFFSSDGEKEWRNRDKEFTNLFTTKEEVKRYWNKGWECFFNTLNIITSKDLMKNIYIRGEKHTVIEAINRQLAHYPYHIGQIVYITKSIKKDQWVSLSIPKNKSGEYNQMLSSRNK